VQAGLDVAGPVVVERLNRSKRRRRPFAPSAERRPMTYATQRDIFTTQPTCRLRQRPPTIGPRHWSLEISHASRLRQKLAAHGERLVINIWGVGYCLTRDWHVDDEVAR
jgi:hypothetical protein